MHGMKSLDQNLIATTPTSFDWQTPPSQLSLNTGLSTSFNADDLDLASFSAGSSMPAISINQREHIPQVASPFSDVPSLWSGDGTTRTSGASSPDVPPTSAPLQFGSIAQHMAGGKSLSVSIEPHTAPSWEFMARTNSDQQKRGPGSSRGHSRRTSASSMSAGSDEHEPVMSPIPEVEDDLLPLAPVPHLPRQGIFAAHAESPTPGSSRSSFTDRSRALATTPLPSRFEAETLTTEFIQYIESLQYRAYNVSSPLFSRFCENVYPNPQHSTATVDLSVSIPMARFHVFLAMATAMKIRIRSSPESTNALMNTCYELAIQQAISPTFWQERGAPEAAQLLAVFASIRKISTEPRPPQQSFTW
jgi:hypothetical protein